MDYSHALKKLASCLVAIIPSTSQLRYGRLRHAQGLIGVFAVVYLIMINKSIMLNKSVTLKFCQRKARVTSFGYKTEDKDFFSFFFSSSSFLRFLLNNYYHDAHFLSL